jgi:hypothetical protein
MNLVEPKHVLASAIIQGLVARGDFTEGSFDKVFPKGVKAGSFEIDWDPDALAGLVTVCVMALAAADTALKTHEDFGKSSSE